MTHLIKLLTLKKMKMNKIAQFFQRGELNFAIGLFLFVIPYLLIILPNYFIKKDEKLVKAADRIR